MSPDVGTVPILCMGQENDSRFMFSEDFGNPRLGLSPLSRILGATLEVDAFQPILPSGNQTKTDLAAASRQLAPSFGLSRSIAPQSDGHIQHVHVQFPQQPQGKSADDHFIIRMRRKNQRLRSIQRNRMNIGRRETTQRKPFSLVNQPSEPSHTPSIAIPWQD